MTMRIPTTIIVLLCTIALAVTAQNRKPIATVFKPIGTVEVKTDGKNWVPAKPAMPLAAGDMVRTQENSFAIVKFLENSVIRVQEKSEVTISGTIAKGEFSKNVDIQQGGVGFQVKKRPNEKFEFSTPTSVASIRGTTGLLLAGQDSNDVLILGSGNIDFLNRISNRLRNVKPGQTAFSFANGSVDVKESSPEDQRLLNQSGADTTKSEGNNGGTSSDSTNGGMSVGMTISAPVGKEGQNLAVAVEISSASVPFDSVRSSAESMMLYYRTSAGAPFAALKGSVSERAVRFTLPAAAVIPPSVSVYAVLRMKDGTTFTVPSASPESNPIVLPVQAAQKNELRIPFTDPSGKKKTMVIEYK